MRAALLAGLAQEVNSSLNNGLYVIISYHVIGWPDGFYQTACCGNPADTYDSSLSLAASFWAQMAQTYGSDTRVIFDLWNEPVHPDDFTLYGSTPNPLWAELKLAYESLIQTVRTNGGQNIVIATGNRWASWLVGIKENLLSDPNVVYAYHKYSVEGSNTAAEWNKDTGGLIGVKPVMVSEWGYEDVDAGLNRTWPGTQASYGDPFTQWMESNNLSNLAWMYHHDWTPALLKSDGSTTIYGSFAKQYISSQSLVHIAGIFTDTWAMQIAPAADPNQLALQLGAQNLGQVGVLSGYYLFRIPGSASQSNTIAALLRANSNVLWFEQQVAHQQSKRDNVLPSEADLSGSIIDAPTTTFDANSQDNESNVSAQDTTLPDTSLPLPATIIQPSPTPTQSSATQPVSTQTLALPTQALTLPAQTPTLQIKRLSISTAAILVTKIAAVPAEYSFIPPATVELVTSFTDLENRPNNGNTKVAIVSIVFFAAGGAIFSVRRKIRIAGKSSKSK